jgi:hypothetical protein
MVLPFLGAVGAAAGGIGSLIGATRAPSAGGGMPSPDYAALYGVKLAPGNTLLTSAAQELAAATGLYGGTESIISKVLGQSAYDQFKLAAQKDQLSTNLAAAIPAQFASEAIGNLSLANKAQLATQLMGPETASALTKQYAATQSQIQDRVLAGETNLLAPAVQMSAAINEDAAKQRNALAQNVASTNLDISKSQEATRNALALQKGTVGGQSKLQRERFAGELALSQQSVEGQLAMARQNLANQMALKQMGASYAWGGQAAFS